MPHPNTWVRYVWPHPSWGTAAGAVGDYERWVQGIVYAGVNLVAAVFRNDAVPLVTVEVVMGSVSGSLGDGSGDGKGFGRMWLNLPLIVSRQCDPVFVAAHEFGHAGLGAMLHVTQPRSLMHAHARHQSDPWDGRFTAADVAAFAATGFRFTGPPYRLLAL